MPRPKFARTNGSEFRLRFGCTNGPAFNRARSVAHQGRFSLVARPQGAQGFACMNGPACGPGFASANGPAFGRAGSLAYHGQSGRAACPGGGPGICLDQRTRVWPATVLGISGPIRPGSLAPSSHVICCTNRLLGPAYGSHGGQDRRKPTNIVG